MKQNNKAKVLVIANGPFVLYLAIKAIEQGVIKADECEVWFVSEQKFSPLQINEFIPSGIRFRQFHSGLFGQIKILLTLQLMFSKFRKSSFEKVYLANLCSLYTNYLAFSVSGIRYGLIIEGIANFYHPTLQEVLSTAHLFKKRVIAFFFGFKFRMYHGPISGIDEIDFDDVITLSSFPNFGLKPHNINLEHSARNKNKNKVAMILDTPNYIFDDRNMVAKLIQSELEGLCRSGYYILYRRHPNYSGPSVVTDEYRAKYNLEDVSSAVPVEMLIEKLHVETVVGFSSSALMTCRYLFPDVRCISLGLKYLSNKIAASKLEATFIHHGIVIR